ncbi:hypothetical protein DFH06DRAFT_1303041 [Mycena polygramma]|nr:hypothetical protein DFH06DRAFT_1303041 [Mycena polygramma]
MYRELQASSERVGQTKLQNNIEQQHVKIFTAPSTLPPMADAIEVDTDVLFDPSKWIGAHKIYKDVPTEVSDACIAARKIPLIVTAKFPHPTLPVSEFLEVKLPDIYYSANKYRTKDWFSTDSPNCDAATLWSITSIPPLHFARDLENDFPQKWLNGAMSIRDPHNRSLCLPLSAVSFYLKIHDLHAAQEKWIESVEWARDEIPDCNPDIFLSVGWNAVHPGAPDGQLDWTRLAGDEWLSGQIIDAMAADIQSRVAAIPALDECVTVAPLSFQRAIVAVSKQKTPSKYTVGLLQSYKDSVDAGKSRLYFPLHVNGNHWIAFFIDFVRRVFGYGDSRSHAVKFAAADFISHLQKWLEGSFSGTFTNLGDIMPHAHQLDFIHCGIYFANTTEHAVFKTPIITSHHLCRPLRMHWLRTINQNALLASGDATPLLVNHNFPDLGPEDFFEQDIPPVPMTSSSALLIAKLMTAVPAISVSPISPSHFRPPSPDPPRLESPPLPPPKKTKAAGSVRKRTVDNNSDDSADSEEERRRRRLPVKKTSANGVKSRKTQTTADQRHRDFLKDVHTVKTSPGVLKGTPHEVFCMCTPDRPRQLHPTRSYDMHNWNIHQIKCELKTGIKPGARSVPNAKKTIVTTPKTSGGILGFFKPTIKLTTISEAPVAVKVTPPPPPATTKKVIVADKRLDASYFSGAGKWPTRLPPPVLVPEEIECRGLHGDGYQEYAWQKGTSYIGGVSATDWVRLAHAAFPYKNWDGAVESEAEPDSDIEAEPLPEKAIRAATSSLPDPVLLAMNGIKEERNNFASRTLYTDYEKQRLHESLITSARWHTHPNTGAVYARDCRSVTTSVTGTCSSCTALAKLPGLKRAIRRAREAAKLSRDDFAARWKKKLQFTPRMLSDSAAADVKASLANPAVLKILSAKAKHGPGGAFLALYQQAQAGDLDDKESFLAICNQFTDRVRREKDTTGRLMKGIRYSPELGQIAALMRSHGPRSGAQYDLLKGMIGGIGQRQLRRRIAKSTMKMVSSELCAENLAAAAEFGKLMNYEGPWIAAGDGTKLRPLLAVSSEYSEPGSAHVLGSTFPLSQVLFKSSEEQSKIISDVDAAKAIATQVWVLAIKIPLPNMPVFAVALIANNGRMKAQNLGFRAIACAWQIRVCSG